MVGFVGGFAWFWVVLAGCVGGFGWFRVLVTTETQKSEHTRSNCDACQVHHFAMQSTFPNAAQLKPQKLVRDGLAQNESNGNLKVKPTQKDIKSATKHI